MEITTIGWGKTLYVMAWPVGADDGGGMEKYLIATIMFFGVAALVLFVMNRNLSEKNAALQQALATQSALLAETQAELQLRDEVIRKRDAEIAEAERKAEAQEGKYARLIRANRVVQEWDAVVLPDDVRGLLKGSADSAAGAAGNSNGGSGNP